MENDDIKIYEFVDKNNQEEYFYCLQGEYYSKEHNKMFYHQEILKEINKPYYQEKINLIRNIIKEMYKEYIDGFQNYSKR